MCVVREGTATWLRTRGKTDLRKKKKQKEECRVHRQWRVTRQRSDYSGAVLEAAERQVNRCFLSNHSSFSTSPSSRVTSTIRTSSPACRDVILITTELSVLSDTVSSTSWTVGRRIGVRRCVGEGGGTEICEEQNRFFEPKNFSPHQQLFTPVSWRPLQSASLTPLTLSHLWSISLFVRFSQFGKRSFNSRLLRHLQRCPE